MEIGQFTAALIVIGNEILSGRTQDKNIAYIGSELNALGVRLVEVRIVLDIKQDIVKAVRECSKNYKYVFTTGGIGPTHDDITAESIAEAFNVPIERNKQAEELLKQYYPPEALNDARLKMADLPVGTELIQNAVTAAPGFKIYNVYILAGVPKIMQSMFRSIANEIKGGQPMKSQSVTCDLPESVIAGELGSIQDNHPDVEIGSYPFFDKERGKGTSLVVRGHDTPLIKIVTSQIQKLISELGGQIK